MPELLKNHYNHAHVLALANRIVRAYPAFPVRQFVNNVVDVHWDALALKARMHKITSGLITYLPADYGTALRILDQVVAGFQETDYHFTWMYLPNFVATQGLTLENWDLSVAALARYTISSTAEFAVRPFIALNQARMMQQMLEWTQHENSHIRRLASEGCRPRLPWGLQLKTFMTDPSPVMLILEQLKADPSLYVRKSVANNLNDIAKDHPELVLSTAEAWIGNNAQTDWIIKHGCRTLLKAGNQRALRLFGVSEAKNITVQNVKIKPAVVSIGAKMAFELTITVEEETKLRIEYAIEFLRANGKYKQKVFQLKTETMHKNSSKTLQKQHSFIKINTRKYYPGRHTLILIINGIPQRNLPFELI